MTIDQITDAFFEDVTRNLTEIASREGYVLEEIRSYGYSKHIEKLAEDFEKRKPKHEASALRIAIALFYLNKNEHEEAAFQISKAGSDASYSGKQILIGELRQLAGECYQRIIKEIFPDRGYIAEVAHYEKLMQERCYNFLIATEAYAKQSIQGERAENCLNRFLEGASEVELAEEKIIPQLRTIRRRASSLSSKIDEYCHAVGISLRRTSK